MAYSNVKFSFSIELDGIETEGFEVDFEEAQLRGLSGQDLEEYVRQEIAIYVAQNIEINGIFEEV